MNDKDGTPTYTHDFGYKRILKTKDMECTIAFVGINKST